MQPIPYVEIVHKANPGAGLPYFIAGGVLLAIFVFVCVRRRRSGAPLTRADGAMGLPEILSVFGVAGVGLGFLLTFVHPSNMPIRGADIGDSLEKEIVHAKAVRAEVRETYGLKLNLYEANHLEYPEKAPKEDFKIYGQLQPGGEDSQLKLPSDSVYLVWTDGELQLAEGSGKNFTELKPKA